MPSGHFTPSWSADTAMIGGPGPSVACDGRSMSVGALRGFSFNKFPTLLQYSLTSSYKYGNSISIRPEHIQACLSSGLAEGFNVYINIDIQIS